MENYRFTLPLLPAPGKLTTVYAVDGGTVRNELLAAMAILLADRGGAGEPVLMIDWDTEAPGLHERFGERAERPGLLEYFAACRAQLALLQGARPRERTAGQRAPLEHRSGATAMLECGEREHPAASRTGGHDAGKLAADSAADAELQRARQVFEAIDWEPFVERVDHSRPLYLMRAGCIDDSYGERADNADWEGLFAASPSLFRCFAEHLGRRFKHVLVASRGGRSAAVSVCTSLLADRLLMLFSPSRRSLDGACGVVRRAIEYRSSHEEAQRPLLVYPVPVDLDGADHGRRLRWRHGDAASETGGYQSALEQLLRESYALPALNLDSYLDHIQVQQLNAMADPGPSRRSQSGDRLSLSTAVAELLEWVADGAFPWQTRAELQLARRIARARADDPQAASPAVQARLADDLLALGRLQQTQGRPRQALASITEGATLQSDLWGAGHADTRAGRAVLAAQLRQADAASDALAVYRSLYEDCAHDLGHGHIETLAARAGLAAALGDCGQFDIALGHAEQVALAWREKVGLNHRATLEAQAAHAALLARAGDPGRARMLFEQVLEGRERVLGLEHADTQATINQLAAVLRQQGHHDTARGLLEHLLTIRQRLFGSDHDATIDAGMALAETAAAQCDLARIGQLCGPLAAACQRRYGRAHAVTRSAELQLATSLAQAGSMAMPGTSAAAAVAPCTGLPPAPSHTTALVPQESGFGASTGYGGCGGYGGHGEAAHRQTVPAQEGAGGEPGYHCAADDVERAVSRLERLDDLAADEARELADRLREPVMLDAVAETVRMRGVRAILGVYFRQGDTDALIAFMQEQRPMPIP